MIKNYGLKKRSLFAIKDMTLSQTKASWCVSITMEIREANETGEHLLFCFFKSVNQFLVSVLAL